MATSSSSFHEDAALLQADTMDRHRATASLIEELEAVDWYDQRIDATGDEELRDVLRHNRDEEKEHAAMALEWLRRHDPELDGFLRTYLFTTEPITQGEAEATGAGATPVKHADLGIGRLRDHKAWL
jgi:ferritin-like protein